MAGAGAKKFPAFSKLSSDDVNDYLADQVIMRFATTAARDAAFGGVGEPTLAEGMTAYIDADNSIYTYDGSNWVKMVSASTPVGLELIKSQSFTSLGTAGLLFTDVFSAQYRNYRVVINIDLTSQDLQVRGRFGAAATLYSFATVGLTAANGADNISGTSQTSILFGYIRNADSSTFSCDIFNPFETRNTQAVYSGFGDTSAHSFSTYRNGGAIHSSATSHTGFTLLTSAGTVNGSIRFYGYRD
jgi:hypothetical protein